MVETKDLQRFDAHEDARTKKITDELSKLRLSVDNLLSNAIGQPANSLLISLEYVDDIHDKIMGFNKIIFRYAGNQIECSPEEVMAIIESAKSILEEMD